MLHLARRSRLSLALGLVVWSSGAPVPVFATPLPPALPAQGGAAQGGVSQATVAQGNAAETWTILVYLHADHNLDPSAVADLVEMQQVGSTANFRIVVQWDRLGPAGVVRGEVQKVPGDDAQLKVVQRLPELNSDDPAVLSDFLAWGLKTYPAKHVGVIMWDHGAQWPGFGGDETNGGGIMSLDGLRQGLANGLRDGGRPKLDFLAFDTCLMGGYEPLAQFADLANLYIAAPEIDYGDGWNYGPTLAFLRDSPGVDMKAFGRREVADWQAQHSENPADLNYRAQAAYDTAGVPRLTAALKAFSVALQAAMGREGDRLAPVRARVVEYSNDADDPRAPKEFVDLGAYARQVAAASSDAALKAAARDLGAAIDGVVLAKSLGKRNADAQALSVWLPSDAGDLPGDAVLGAYARLAPAQASDWSGFVRTWLTGEVQPNADDPTVRVVASSGTDAVSAARPVKITFEATAKDVTAVYGSVTREVAPDVYDAYGDLFYEEAEPGRYDAEWDGLVLTVSDGRTTDFFPGFLEEPDGAVLNASAVYRAPGGEEFDVTVLLDAESEKIIGVLDESGPSPRNVAVQAGGQLKLEFLRYKEDEDEPTAVPTGKTLTIPAGGLEALKVSAAPVPPGKYAVEVGATDWAGNADADYVDVTVR